MICLDCNTEKPIEEFTANRGKSIRRCKLCSKDLERLQKDQYYIRNKETIDKRQYALWRARQDEWNLYLQSKFGDPYCQICNRKLTWPGGQKELSVHFDHRHGGNELIKCQPSKWMRVRYCTLDNQKIFESCDFGLLCNSCNRMLPTQNRDFWIQKLLEYHEQTKANFTN